MLKNKGYKNKKYIILVLCILCLFIIFPTNVEAAKSTLDDSGIETAFPNSYKPYLRELAKRRPNWKFVAVNTNVHWSECLNEETVNGKSLIPISYSNEWKESDVQIEPGWVNASDSAIAYALDPRNFLTESEIFQFEITTNDSNIHTAEVIDNVLDGVPMGDSVLKTKYKKAGTWIDMAKSYSQIIAEVAIANNVSGVHLASRIRQETSGDIINNKSIYGSYPGYEGYYNFFNIGATTANGDTPIVNALKRAKAEGWDTPEKSINAAGKKIYNDYIKWGQNTVYFEKWDVNDPSGGNTLFWMQYMSNILAPSSESKRIYTAYSKSEKLDSNFVFHIPVYLGMPNEPVKVGEEVKFEDDNTKVYLDDPSDVGVNDVFTIRTEPNTNSSVVTTITETQEGAQNRTKLIRIKKGINVQWDKVRLENGVEGYIFAEYVYVYEDYVKVSSLQLDKHSISLKSGEKETLKASVLPEDAEFKKVIYSSNNESVVSVDENGVVTARGLGDATVFAMSEDQTSIIDTCYVLVKYTDVIETKLGKTISILKEKFKDAKFVTNNSNILNVSYDGEITGIGLGDASIFVYDANGITLATYYVSVGYTDNKFLKIGESINLEIENATKYYTNNKNVVELIKDGIIVARGLGDATVFAEDSAGKLVAMIYVKNSYTDSKYLKVGENVKLNIKTANNYYTNNENVVTVTKNGIITARGLGDATVFVEDSARKLVSMIYVKNSYTDSKYLKVGENVKLDVENATSYYTNNENVVTVTKSGIITARGLGDATVFALDSDGKLVAMVYVKNSYTDSKYLKVGENVKLDIENAISYYTNNNSILEVTKNGVITAIFLGDATVFALDSDGKVISMLYVSVGYTANQIIHCDESVKIKEKFALVSDKYDNIKFSVNNDKVAQIVGDNILGKSVGECTLFVKDANNRNLAMFYILVKEYVEVEEVKVENTELNLKVGDIDKINAYVVPDNAKYKELNYNSDNSYSVSVNTVGEIEAKFIGQSTITIKSTDKKSVKEAKCKVTVGYNANIETDIETSKNLSDYLDLSKYKNSLFTSNNENVVKVNQNGNIEPIGIGDASIFINSVDGKLLAMVYVKVIDYIKVSEIKLEEKTINLKVGDKYNIKYEINPTQAKYKDVEFKSSDGYIASVDANGMISANFIGEAIVTLVTKDKKNIVSNQLKVINNYTEFLEININQAVDIYQKLNLKDDISNYVIETNNSKVLSIDTKTFQVTGISNSDASIFIKDKLNNIVAMVYINVK